MSITELKRHLKPGHSYRRGELVTYSPSVDRELKKLVKIGYVKKERNGLYSRLENSKFGEVPVNTKELVKKFLNTNDFLIVEYNKLNNLGLGLTQLYKEMVVYNHKRHGHFKLGSARLYFKRRNGYPREVDREFLLVEFLNERKRLAEEVLDLDNKTRSLMGNLNISKLKRYAKDFGKVAVKKMIDSLVENYEKDFSP
ncbi:hypothetical protein [Leptospira bandrabouensis]|uniref:Type IV toxin-antitoxin system AbiEi family antitoxin domain-containing protein n=1 Tax=Leptospira bandrabouensis TaxID=2484903 RepID=A0A6H3NL46_9LEPT|nr:hypothetical protein [Leptospira bandrabouensis]TGN11613.1 hypothetical protein EHR08_17120 [Leptospira bandrabouensis]